IKLGSLARFTYRARGGPLPAIWVAGGERQNFFSRRQSSVNDPWRRGVRPRRITAMKTLKAYLVLTTAAGALSVASAAHATTIDFSTYAIGTAISSIPGASVSLLAGPGPGGSPTIGNFGNSSFPVGLGNSTTNGNPTGTMIDFAFTRPVSGISFTFDNYGDNGPVYPSRYWTSADGTYVSWGEI